MTMCKRCHVPKWWQGDDRNCAFKSGVFSSDNWNCGTANAIRDLMERGNGSWLGDGNWRPDCWRTRYDDNSMGAIAVPETVESLPSRFVVAAWYKNRGKTDSMYFLGTSAEPVSLADAERILDAMPADE